MKYLILIFIILIGCQSAITPAAIAPSKQFDGTWYMQGDCKWTIKTGAEYLILNDVKYIGTYTADKFIGATTEVQLHIALYGNDSISGYYSTLNKPNLYFEGVRMK